MKTSAKYLCLAVGP